MRENVVFDARKTLGSEALADMKLATRVVFAFKDPGTGVIGYWITSPGKLKESEDYPRAVLIQGRILGIPSQDATLRGPHIAMAIEDAQKDELWDRFIHMLRPGDVMQLKGAWSSDLLLSSVLDVHHGLIFHATISFGTLPES